MVCRDAKRPRHPYVLDGRLTDAPISVLYELAKWNTINWRQKLKRGVSSTLKSPKNWEERNVFKNVQWRIFLVRHYNMSANSHTHSQAVHATPMFVFLERSCIPGFCSCIIVRTVTLAFSNGEGKVKMSLGLSAAYTHGKGPPSTNWIGGCVSPKPV
jgi:hypothetical protein